jgi:predicted phosphoribosyltransferase
MLVAVEAVRNAGAEEVVVAAPTAPASTAGRMVDAVDALYVANVRRGARFAVAAAYRDWYDVSEDEVAALLTC